MKFIGIRGHRGAGKDLIAYVIGKTLNYMSEYNDRPDYNKMTKWINEIIEDEHAIHNQSFKYVYIDSFGDTVKTFVMLLTGCKSEDVYNDYLKDHTYINMITFERVVVDGELPEDMIVVSGESLVRAIDKAGHRQSPMANFWMSMREFILYFGQEVMKKYFGADVWIKAMRRNDMFEDFFSDRSYKIFRDIKTSDEITFVKDKGGVIIKIDRPRAKKSRGMDKLSRDRRFDYNLNIPENVYDIYKDVIKICESIKNENENGKESSSED